MNIPGPVIPKEHGAWAVLFIPMSIAALVAHRASFPLLLLALSALALFMSYVPVHTLLRHLFIAVQPEARLSRARLWAVVYLALGTILIIPLLLKGYVLLLVFGVAGMIGFFGNFALAIRHPKTIPGDLLAVFGLSMSAPSAYYVVTGKFDATGFSVWLLNFLFFASSVFYVHVKIKAVMTRKSRLGFDDKISLGKLTLVYHCCVLLIVGALIAIHYAPLLAILAFVPITTHAVYGTANLSAKVRFKNLGFLLLAHSLGFGILLTVSQTQW